jgi:alcohol dehydrogenase
MNNFQFYSPTKFVFGKHVEAQVGALTKQQNARKVLIHYGGGSVVKSGLLATVKASLAAVGIESIELGGVVPNPRSGLVYQGIELARNEHIDFILAVGGGSVIDSAKAIAIGVPYQGDFWDFYNRKARIQTALPVGVVLTIPAAGSEASTATVITHEDGMLKRGTGSDLCRPVFAVINPELTYTIPVYHAAAGVVDMMSHIFERYLTKTTGVELTDRLAEGALLAIIDAANVMIKDPYNYDARATLCWAGTIAHNDLLGLGREEDWSTHILEHELSAKFDVSHGAGLAVMFPAFMKYTIDEDVMRYRRLAVNVFGIKDDLNHPRDVALQGIAKMTAFFQGLGMPSNFAELGVPKDAIDELLAKLKINRGTAFGSFKHLNLDDAKQIYLLAAN